MGRRVRRWIAAALLLALVIGGFVLWTRPPSEPEPTKLMLATVTPQGEFTRARTPRPIVLPADQGPHPEYQTEWWYYTGNLETEERRHFGYQLTFFRRAMTPSPMARSSTLAADQIYFAHFALTDVEGEQHWEWERFSRGAAGLAGAQPDPFRVWLEDWSAGGRNEDEGSVGLIAAANGTRVELELRASKPLVQHGQMGLSLKGEEPGNASYYLSYTRMETSGSVAVADELHAVDGTSWFDHEWSTSALGPEAIGWDWFSLQLSDGRDLMYFQIRRADGGIEPASMGTLVSADGSTGNLELAQVTLEVEDRWRSPESHATYPARWRLQVPSEGIDLMIEPWLQDQEMNLSIVYWEGAVRIRGQSAGQTVRGQGYVELTGYAETMQGRF